MTILEVEDVLLPWTYWLIGISAVMILVATIIGLRTWVLDRRAKRRQENREALGQAASAAILAGAMIRSLHDAEVALLVDTATINVVSDKRRRTHGFLETDIEPDIGILPDPDPIDVS